MISKVVECAMCGEKLPEEYMKYINGNYYCDEQDETLAPSCYQLLKGYNPWK